MTNSIALGLGLVIVAALMLDVTFFGTQHVYFLAGKLIDLIEWLAFWR